MRDLSPRLGVKRPAEASSRGRPERDGRGRAAMVCEQSARAVDRAGNSRRDGLVDGYGSSAAVMRRTRLVGLARLPVDGISLAVRNVVLLLEGPVSLLVDFAVAVTLEGGTAVMSLAVHDLSKLLCSHAH